jgi:hypothetical protein
VLLYLPEDRALQEFFIASNAVTTEDLHVVFDAVKHTVDWQGSITLDDISLLTDLPIIKVRVSLAELERTGMLEHLGDQGLRMRVQVNSWKPSETRAITEKLKLHRSIVKNNWQLWSIMPKATPAGARSCSNTSATPVQSMPRIAAITVVSVKPHLFLRTAMSVHFPNRNEQP